MSTPLSPDNDYQQPPEPARARWDRETADTVLGSIGRRLRALEAKGTELQDLIDDLSFLGIQRLDQAINPLIAGVQAEVAALRTTVAETLAANARIVSDFQAVTAVNLGELQEQIDEVQDRVNVILAGGLDAADVRESPARVFVSPAQRAEIAQLRTDLAEVAAREIPKVLPPIVTVPAPGSTPAIVGGALALSVDRITSLYGRGQKTIRFQVSTVEAFASTVFDSGVLVQAAVSASIANAQSLLVGGATYYVRARQTDVADNASDWSAPSSFVFPRVPSAPAMSAPANGATGLGAQNAAITLTASAYAHPNGTAQASRVFEIATTSTFATLVASVAAASGASSASIPAPKDVLQPNTLYHVRCRDTDANGGSSTSPATTFTTATVFLPNIGDAYQGGFFVGQIKDGGTVYHLIVAPKSGGETNRTWNGQTSAGTNGSRTAGPVNSAASSNTSATGAARFCEDLVLNGYSDWYLPAIDELEVAYRNLKPTAEQNQEGLGANTNSVPVGANYTAASPAQTTVAAFKAGGAEAFATTDWTWSSTEVHATSAEVKHFNTGQDRRGMGLNKGSSLYVRAFRRVAA